MALGNTAVRILVSVVAIPALVLLSYFGGVYFLSFVLIITGISFYEFSLMAKSKGAMQLRTLQTLDGLGPTASNTVVVAVPIEIMELVNYLTDKKK